MTQQPRERLAYRLALGLVVLAALGTLFASGEPETTLFMVSAVIAGLVCFDTSMERQLHSRLPWIFISLAPILKTVPLVWFELKANDELLVERYEHVGSLLFGICVFIAVVLLARPAESVGTEIALFDAAVVLGSAVTAAVAGASVAYLFDSNFGSVATGRMLETPTWFIIGGLLAAVVISASHIRDLSAPLAVVLMMAASASALLAFTVAGGTVDPGWWALVFAGFALATGAFGPAALGERRDRDRRSHVGVVIAIAVGFIAAAAAISARSDPSSWGPGWAVLGVLALSMFALAMASRPVDEPIEGQITASGLQDIGLPEVRSPQGADATELPAAPVQTVPPVRVASRAQQRRLAASTRLDTEQLDSQKRETNAPATPVRSTGVEPTTTVASPTTALPAAASQPPAEPLVRAARPVTPEPQTTPKTPISSRPLAAGPLSDTNLVAAARAAAAVREAPSAQRHAIAPLAQAHHFDPSTGLLSAAGLQHALGTAFATPRQAGHVTIMLFTIRDLDEIERRHGRLASAAVTRDVADRVRTLLPSGTGARFARAAYAVIFVGDLGDAGETVQRLAKVLLRLRAPVEQGVVGDKIDVVAGMAQCYEGEDVANFVQRANQGLARAVQTVEPTFVAMP